MAATKQLNPAAPPFHRPRHLAPAPPPPAMATMLPYHAGAGACPPPMGAAFYFCAEFPFAPFPDHHHHHQFVQFPVLHQSPATRILRKRLVSGKKKPPPARVFRKGGVVPAKPSRLSVKSSGVPEAVSSPPTKVACESAVPDEPPAPVLPEDVGEPAPHGLPPHKLMTTARKQQQQQEDEVTTPVAAKDVAHAAPAPGAAARVARRRAERRSNRHRKSGRRDGAVVGPRGWTTAWAPKSTVTKPREVPLRAWTTWAPTSTFTKPREAPLSGKPPAMLGRCTTVMVRNIPNRLKGDEMIALLDEHCARANRVAGDVVSAYDVAYLPIDFRRQGNFGYAFVNFTTPNAGLLLYYALQGCGWKVCGSRKHIDIVPAKIQGKEELVRHFSRHKFECETKEFLPAVFTPARDGGARATSTTTTRVGKLLPAPAPAPRHAKKA